MKVIWISLCISIGDLYFLNEGITYVAEGDVFCTFS